MAHSIGIQLYIITKFMLDGTYQSTCFLHVSEVFPGVVSRGRVMFFDWRIRSDRFRSLGFFHLTITIGWVDRRSSEQLAIAAANLQGHVTQARARTQSTIVDRLLTSPRHDIPFPVSTFLIRKSNSSCRPNTLTSEYQGDTVTLRGDARSGLGLPILRRHAGGACLRSDKICECSVRLIHVLSFMDYHFA